MAYAELSGDCIICLSNIPDVIKYDAPCECKPYIHTECLSQWFVVNPNTCPICKTNYEGYWAGSDLVLRAPKNHICLVLLMAVLFSLFIYLEYFL
jgi:hypothetical protein